MKKIGLLLILGIFFTMTANVALAADTKTAGQKPLYELTATEAADLIKKGEITSEALVTELLARIKAHAELNAYITVDEKAVLEAAKAADAAVKDGKPLGKLHGVPIAVKDNIDVEGLPTTAGTPALEKHYPSDDAALIAKLKAEGAIIWGKTNLHELAFGITGTNGHYGNVTTPYSKNHLAGGSSSGTGAAVSGRLATVGIGTDTGGSIRIPASINGLYGYRPSVGRYSVDGVVPMSVTKDTPGPIARSMADVILIDSVVNDYDPAGVKPMELKGLRIGMPKYSFWEDLDPETARLTLAAVEKLKAAGAVIVEDDIADIDKLDRDVDFPMSLYECKRDFVGFFEPYGIKIEDVIGQIGSPDVKGAYDNFVLGEQAVTKEAYDEVMNKFRPIMVKAYEDYFARNQVDFIIIPTTVRPAKSVAEPEDTVELNGKQAPTFPTYVKNTSPGSNVGIAGVSLPVGLTKDGLPVGIEVDALSGNDAKLLSLALALEALFGPVPPPANF